MQPARTITVSSAVARLVSPETEYVDRLAAARGETALIGRDLLTALYFLYSGGDREIRSAVVRTLRQQPVADLVAATGEADLAPRILHFLAQVRGNDPSLFQTIMDHPLSPRETLLFLLEHAVRPLFPLIHERKDLWEGDPELVAAFSRNPQLDDGERSALLSEESETGEERGEESSLDEEEEEESSDYTEDPEEFTSAMDENLSKYQIALELGVSEKIKMALTGDKEWRSILLKDSNKLVNTAVLKNPRITDGEVLALAKNKTTNEELIRLIIMNKEWVKLTAIRSALVSHPKTPVGSALRFMDSLTIKELKDLSKSKFVSQVVVTAARRVMADKAKKK